MNRNTRLGFWSIAAAFCFGKTLGMVADRLRAFDDEIRTARRERWQTEFRVSEVGCALIEAGIAETYLDDDGHVHLRVVTATPEPPETLADTMRRSDVLNVAALRERLGSKKDA